MAQSKPYIGVTGFVSSVEVTAALEHVPEHAPRQFMVGVLASYKSMRRIPLRERWAKQTPNLDTLQDVFPDYERRKETLYLVHYSGEEDTLCEDMVELVRRVKHKLDGFQLNLVWPAPHILEQFHNATHQSRRKIVVQVSRAAVERAGGTPAGVIAHVAMYRGLADYILLDASGGEGHLLDVKWAMPYIDLFYDAGFPLRYGIAGGLGVRSMEPIQQLLEEFPDLSWDAQGRLRDQRNELDLEAVGGYLDQSFALVR